MADRDSHGRYVKGHPGGPGRPKRAVEADFLRALTDTVSPEDWRSIMGNVVEQAKAGDMKCISFLARYLLGTPSGEAPSLTGLAQEDAGGPDPATLGLQFDAAESLLHGLRAAPPPVEAPTRRPSIAEELAQRTAWLARHPGATAAELRAALDAEDANRPAGDGE